MTELQSLLPDNIKENIKLAIMDVGLKEEIKAIGIEELEKILHRLKKQWQISKREVLINF